MREGSRVTGVEVQTSSGKTEIITLAHNGRVVLAAGALSTPRLLFNSGIGPKNQIETAKNSGITVPDEKDWINLPVESRTTRSSLSPYRPTAALAFPTTTAS